MDLHGYSRGEHGRLEQILHQFLLKSLHVILDSRIPASRPSNSGAEISKSDKWFNLALGDRPAAMDSLSFWNRGLMEPMVIDILLVRESIEEHASLGTQSCNETVLERWIVQYDHQRSIAPQVAGDASYKKTYKKSIILLRSVHAMLRLLPAYKAFRKLRSLRQNCDFDINYKICSFSTPFPRKDEELMKKYSFFPVEAPLGRVSVSLTYRKDLSEFNLDSIVSYPPEIITDYVGSPLTDRMRAFPPTSSARTRPTSFPVKGKQSNEPFQRPHSWTSGLHKELSSQKNQPFSGSPPLYKSPYEYSLSSTDTCNLRNQALRSLTYQKPLSGDLLSPPFSSSPSPSPSPPTHPVHGRLHSDTAPMNIPHPMMGRSPRFNSPNLSDPNKNSLPPLSPRNTKYGPSSHESPSGSRTMRRQDSIRSGELSSGSINTCQKVSRDTKEDSGRFSSLPSSGSSPHAGISRSSSRLSFQDDFADSDFLCPFIVDDMDPPEIQTRSKDAAVGALVHMLRTAPPLRQDTNYNYASKTQVDIESGTASEFFRPRKTSDALEELKAYKEMKDILLSKSTSRMAMKADVGT